MKNNKTIIIAIAAVAIIILPKFAHAANITSCSQLSSIDCGANHTLTQSLDCSSASAIAPLCPSGFSGTFNGNRKLITGLEISCPSGSGTDCGLFGKAISPSNIYELKLEDISFSGVSDNAGSVVGHLDGGTVTNVGVKNAVVTAVNYAGGIAGLFPSGGIDGSYFIGSVVAQSSFGGYEGGISGNKANGASIESSYSSASVTKGGGSGNCITSGDPANISGVYFDSTKSCTDQSSTSGITGLNPISSIPLSIFKDPCDGYSPSACAINNNNDGYPALEWEKFCIADTTYYKDSDNDGEGGSETATNSHCTGFKVASTPGGAVAAAAPSPSMNDILAANVAVENNNAAENRSQLLEIVKGFLDFLF